MQRVIPFESASDALRELDNGGRIYNLFTDPNDGRIEHCELCKAAGVWTDRVGALIYFDLALSRLNHDQQRVLIGHLERGLASQYLKMFPFKRDIEVFDKTVKKDEIVAVEGYPRFLEDRTAFVANIMVPMSNGKAMAFMMVPIYDQYDVYEVFADEFCEGVSVIVTTQKQKQHFTQAPMTFGGPVRELQVDEGGRRNHRHYLETRYYVV